MRLFSAPLLPVGTAALAAVALAGALFVAWPRPLAVPTPAPAPAARAPAAWDVPAIARAQLFGAAAAAAPTPPAPPPTLRLTGVLDGAGPGARALIAGPDGVQRPYARGAALPGGGVLVDIQARSARVDFDGRAHTLTLPETVLRSATPRPTARSFGGTRQAMSPAVAAARARVLARQSGAQADLPHGAGD